MYIYCNINLTILFKPEALHICSYSYSQCLLQNHWISH